jgi:hypothetical protein
MIDRFKAALQILTKGEKYYMSGKMNEMKVVKIKDTDDYVHYKLDGVSNEDLDLDTVKTVCLPNGGKLVTAKNTKTGETVGFSLLVKKAK